MCGCATARSEPSAPSRQTPPGRLTFRVADMTCRHCAGAIAAAIETALPGTHVEADPGSKLVSIQGSADRDAIEVVIAQAGYTPSDAALG